MAATRAFAALVVAATACSGGGGAGDTPGDPSGLPPRSHVAVAPQALLLTATGEQSVLRAAATDAAGRPMSGAVAWASSQPEVVSVDGEGRVEARADVGSAQITATVAGVVSAPVLVTIGRPAPGAVLVTDAQVLSGPDAVDPNAPLDLGFQVRLTLAQGIAVAPGAILLGREGKPVAGRVVSATATAAGTDVVLELVALPDLFRGLSVDGTYRIDAYAMAEAPAQKAVGVARKFAVGPFECEGSGSGGALTAEAKLTLVPDVDVDWHLAQAPDGTVTAFTVLAKGTVTATGSLNLKFSPSVSATLTCSFVATRVPLPIAGALSAVAGLKVPIGGKLQVAFGLTAGLATLGAEVKATSETTAGFTYTPEGGLVPAAAMTDQVDVKPKFTLTDSGLPAVAAITAGIGPTVGLEAGITLPLLPASAAVSLLDGWLQLKASGTLTPALVQLAEPALAAKYDAKVALTIGPGKDVGKALKFLGGAAAIKPALEIEHTLATSPKGAMTASAAEVHPGESVDLAVTLDPATTRFLLLDDNVDELRIYHAAPGGMPPEVIATLGGAQGTWTWHPTIVDIGTHYFWATAVTPLCPGLPLEVKDDSSVAIHVAPQPTGLWQGPISFEVSGTESGTSGQYASQWDLSGSGTTTVRARADTPELLDEVSAAASATWSETTTFTPDLTNANPDSCYYRVVTHRLSVGTQLAPDHETLAAQLLVNELAGLYTLAFLPPKLVADMTTTATSSLVQGPGTCDPGGTTTTQSTDTILFDLVVDSGTFTPYGDTISGSTDLTTGSMPVRTYHVTWTLTRQ